MVVCCCPPVPPFWRAPTLVRKNYASDPHSAIKKIPRLPPDELAGAECHGAVPRLPVAAVIFVAEGHAALVESNEAAVRDGDAMGVAGEIGEDGLRRGERLLGVDDPCDRKSSGEEDEHEVLKPFGAIQRVQLPPGKGQPTSRKRALHGVRRRPS